MEEWRVTARPASLGAVGRHVADWPGHTYAGNNLDYSQEGTQEPPSGNLQRGLVALGSSCLLQQPVGTGGLQPHPGQPLHTLSCPGPVPHTQGLPGTLIRYPQGTSVPTHRTHLSMVPQDRHTHGFSLS